ncbi:hypothetical protein RND71_020908 [Anisodus tanguticus]|uniref:Uncharacterized protein n=1 Tax=Anisodus tanguticus TaxID=243964 RepID=A0AAE1RUA7_9SOLA|nr:hypothetical protein RND71_020908 [Anisodus tanguticus]
MVDLNVGGEIYGGLYAGHHFSGDVGLKYFVVEMWIWSLWRCIVKNKQSVVAADTEVVRWFSDKEHIIIGGYKYN